MYAKFVKSKRPLEVATPAICVYVCLLGKETNLRTSAVVGDLPV